MTDPSDAMYLVVGFTFLAGAAGLLLINFGDRLNRAFALYLILEGGAMITFTVPRGPAEWQFGLRGLFTYLALATSFPLLYLAAVYRDRFGRPGLRRVALPVLVGLAALVVALHMMDKTLFFGTGARPLRPLHYLLILLGPTFMAALLGDDALREMNPRHRNNLLVASLAFAFYPTAFALHLFVVPDLMATHLWEEIAALLGLVPIGYIVARLLRVAAARDADLKQAVRRYLGVLLLSPLSVAILGTVNLVWPEAGDAFMRYIMTGWLVVLAALVAYAVLRHQLFGIEMGLKWTLRRGWLPGSLVAIVFVAIQVGENYAENQLQGYSWLFAGLAAATIGSLYRPIQKRMDNFAARAMPGVEKTPQYATFRRLQLYQSALAAVWEDGILHRDERQRLERLRKKLGISDVDAHHLEAEFVRSSVQPKARRTPKVLRGGPGQSL